MSYVKELADQITKQGASLYAIRVENSATVPLAFYFIPDIAEDVHSLDVHVQVFQTRRKADGNVEKVKLLQEESHNFTMEKLYDRNLKEVFAEILIKILKPKDPLQPAQVIPLKKSLS